jgi:hypothetical protein
MAKNPPTGDNARKEAVRKQPQTFNPIPGQYGKRDADTGRFPDVKEDGKPFRGVRRERKNYSSKIRTATRWVAVLIFGPAACKVCAGGQGG